MEECPYCTGRNTHRLLAKHGWTETDPYFTTDYHLHRCGDCDLMFAAPITARHRQGMERYFAASYNLNRGATHHDHIAAIWPEPSASRTAVGWLKSWLRPVKRRLFGNTTDFEVIFGDGRAGEALALLHRHGARSLLDIGCSYGGFVKLAADSGIRAYGLEPTHEVVQALTARGVRSVRAGFFPQSHGPQEHYHALTMFHVLVHMVPTLELFAALRARLYPGGTLLVFATDTDRLGAPELVSTFTSPLALNFTSPAFMERAARDAGFSGYRSVPCRGEPICRFHMLTA